jgi:hypothetical protein
MRAYLAGLIPDPERGFTVAFHDVLEPAVAYDVRFHPAEPGSGSLTVDFLISPFTRCGRKRLRWNTE